MRIKVNIHCFGDRFCSNNTEYKLLCNARGIFYVFKDNRKAIIHNEYDSAIEYKDGSYEYRINNKKHRLFDCAIYYSQYSYKEYWVIGEYLGCTNEHFLKNLANELIPKK